MDTNSFIKVSKQQLNEAEDIIIDRFNENKKEFFVVCKRANLAPFAPETVVYSTVPAGFCWGTRVSVREICTAIEEHGQIYLYLMGENPGGKWTACYKNDKGSKEIGWSQIFVRHHSVHKKEQEEKEVFEKVKEVLREAFVTLNL